MNSDNHDSSADKNSLRSNLRSFLSCFRWSIKRTWSTSRLLTIGLLTASLINCAFPAGLALTARGLINSVNQLLQDSSKSFDDALFWLIAGLVLALLEAACRLTSAYISNRLNDEVSISVTSDILTHAAALDTSTFENPSLQDVLARAKQNAAGHFSRFIAESLSIASGVIQVVSLSVIIFVIEPLVVPAILLIGLPYLVFKLRLAKRRYLVENSRAAKRRLTNYYVNQLTNHTKVPETKLLNLAPLFIDKFKSIMRGFRDQDREIYRSNLTGGFIFSAISTLVLYGLFFRVVFRAVQGAVTIGDVAIYVGIVTRLGKLIDSIISTFSKAVERTLFISNLDEFLSLRPSLASTSSLAPSTSRGEIEFKKVSFSYPGSPQRVLSDVSLHIRPGETVALVGEIGAGKSTLVKLVARLYGPDSGQILFDGIDISDIPVSYLQSQVSFVFQNYGCYEATARDNIAYGNWEEMLGDEKRVKEIALRSGADEMIKSLSNGYNTVLGRTFGECDLSGGQWQKLAIARAFARESSVVILDEPASNLDARSEWELYSRFKELAKGRTTILISHRFSTVGLADRIIVLHGGRIVEEGTHQELLDRAGRYAYFYGLRRQQLGLSIS